MPPPGSRKHATATGVGIVDKLIAQGAVPCIPELRPLARAVLARLIDHFNTQSGRCDPSVETLARDLGRTARAITREISELRDRGLIAVDYRRGTGTTNQYYPNFEAIKQNNPTYAAVFQTEIAHQSATLTRVSKDPDRDVTASLTQVSDKQSNKQINRTGCSNHRDQLLSRADAGRELSGNKDLCPNKGGVDWQGWIEWLGSKVGHGSATLWILTAIETVEKELGVNWEIAASIVDRFLKRMRKRGAPASSINQEFRVFLESRRDRNPISRHT